MSAASGVETSVQVGTVGLPNPVIAASGTFGYGTEFAGLVDLATFNVINAALAASGTPAGDWLLVDPAAYRRRSPRPVPVDDAPKCRVPTR